MVRSSHLTLIVACLAFAMLTTTACKSDEQSEPSAESEQEQAATDEASTSDDEAAQKEAADDEAADDEAADEGESKKAELPDDLPAGESGTYGGEFSIEDEPVSLASALETAESGKTYKVSARVEKVCKKKGCWFTLTDEGVDEPVRVKMKDYGFFVPRNTDGATAIVEGELIHRTVPKKEAEHYAKDEVAGTDEQPREVEGDQEKWEMMITAAQLEMPAAEDTKKN